MTRSRFTQQQFDDALAAMIRSIAESGETRCRVVSRDLHRAVVGASQPNRMPMACNAMWKLAQDLSHTVVQRTPSGRSSSLDIEYRIATTANARTQSSRREHEPSQAISPRRPSPAQRVLAGTASTHGLPHADLHLVACVKLKRDAPMQASELYSSPWFHKARACVERTGRPWAILSAKHGLLWPDQTIAPYEQTLAGMPVSQQRRWADTVLTSLTPHLRGVRTISMLAGTTYRRLLVPRLKERRIDVYVPMAGLTQGLQLRWLNQCLGRAPDRPESLFVSPDTDDRWAHIRRFYDCLAGLERRLGGARKLSNCSGRMRWPVRGVYFLLEPGETRSDTGRGSRVVRVGTHGLTRGSKSTLWGRLAQHRGTIVGGGNHRTSVFRLIVGTALLGRDELRCPSWDTPARTRSAASEETIEAAVSGVIGRMSVLWLSIADEPGPDSIRGYIERNAISLLSNSRRRPVDPPSSGWLGRYCERQKVRLSGLWNSDHVDARYEPAFLDEFARLVDRVRPDS